MPSNLYGRDAIILQTIQVLFKLLCGVTRQWGASVNVDHIIPSVGMQYCTGLSPA